jgi:hypothetical protein
MTVTRPKSKFKTKYKILLGIVVLLITFRIFLPTIVLNYVNKTLAKVPGYYGHVDDIDIALYRGAYQIKDIYLNKKDNATQKQTEFFKAKLIDLSIEWRALFKGKLAGELEFFSPTLIFTKDKAELGDVKKDTSDFREILSSFMPFKINRFEVTDGTIAYKDPGATPNVDIRLKETYVLAQNLTNANSEKAVLPATVTARAKTYGGTVDLNMKLNPLEANTPFDLSAELKNVNLVELNDFFKAYANVDVNKGTLGLYTEFASKDRSYVGYVKPIIKDLDVLGPEDKTDNFFRKVWEGIVGGAGVLLENKNKDQVATKVPIEGNYSGSHTNIIEAIWQLLRNAFIQALMPSLDNQISLKSVAEKKEKDDKTLFQKIFPGKKKKAEEKKKKNTP